MNTTVVDEVGSTQVITSEMDEAAFLRSQIVEIRRRKDGLYAERAEHANTEVQIRLLLELVDEGKDFVLEIGSHIRFKRKLFEEYLDKVTGV